MENHRIEAQVREGRGKGPARQLRRSGEIPAVLYGRDTASQALTVHPDTLNGLSRSPLGWNTPIRLTVAGSEHLVMVAGVQRHPLSRQLLHADFRVVRDDQPVTVTVPVRVEGKSKAEQAGGFLHVFARRVEVRCLPADIPPAVVIDATELDQGARVMASDLKAPEGVSVVYARNFRVVTAEGVRVEAAEAAPAAAAPVVATPAAKPAKGKK